MLSGRLRLDIHARIAIFFFIGHVPVLAILNWGDFEPKLQHGVTLFVFSLTAIILSVPYVLRYALIRRWFCWIDALTAKEMEVLISFRIVKNQEFRRAPDYINRIKPFLYRTGVTSIIFSLIGNPMYIDPDLSIICGTFSCYLLGVVLTIIASLVILAPIMDSQS
ncbi:MAG: hypothetical protein HY306_09820 [Nitrosomonadales bacterium]|nr:hypothetical protein [Nitrosomonadales bacterium]